MAETRMVKTRIWGDGWFSKLSEEGQRLFLFLITNKNTRICGYYELPLFEICAHMKWDEKKTLKVMEEVTAPAQDQGQKVIYKNGWVGLPKYPEHQNVANNPKVQKAIERELKNVPPQILNHNSEIINHNSVPIDRVSIGYEDDDKKTKKTAEQKQKYGQFETVRMTKQEYAQLVDRLGKVQADEMIQNLDEYIASKGKKYKSHYATILSWARKNGITKQVTKNKYDL